MYIVHSMMAVVILIHRKSVCVTVHAEQAGHPRRAAAGPRRPSRASCPLWMAARLKPCGGFFFSVHKKLLA